MVSVVGKGEARVLRHLRLGLVLETDPSVADGGGNWGAFDPPTDTHLEMHIFVGHKGDYYDIADGLPQEG